MGVTLYEILHCVKYQVFTANGISKLQYEVYTEISVGLGQGGGHYPLDFKP